MQINDINNNFSGAKLHVVKPQKWPKSLSMYLDPERNKGLKNFLDNQPSSSDVFVRISKRTELVNPKPGAFHRKGDPTYKILIDVQDKAVTFADKLKQFFGMGGTKYNLGFRHYHSATTIIERLSSFSVQAVKKAKK